MNWFETYLNVDNPFAWTNLVLLIGFTLWYFPSIRERWHKSRKAASEADKVESINQNKERGSLLESIQKLEQQISSEINARIRLQSELDQLKLEFESFKRISVEKESDYLKQIEMLKSKNNSLQAELDSVRKNVG